MAWILQGARVQRESPATVIRLWLYAAVSVVLGAWLTPVFYNAGKALAEVSARKTTNGALEWLAKRCELAEFPTFFVGSILLVAALLFFPAIEWIFSRSRTRGPSMWRWLFEPPEIPAAAQKDGSLFRLPGNVWLACKGFAMVTGLILAMGGMLAVGRDFILTLPAQTLHGPVLRSMLAALLLALGMEVFFRGIALGIFARSMKPALAVAMSAVFFACTLAVIPPPGLNVPDPDASGTGFELLGRVITEPSVGRNLLASIVPLLALGVVLGLARWRSGSLILPVGLHAGWISGADLSGQWFTSSSNGRAFPIGTLIQESIIPLIAILLVGWFIHRKLPPPDAPILPDF